MGDKVRRRRRVRRRPDDQRRVAAHLQRQQHFWAPRKMPVNGSPSPGRAREQDPRDPVRLHERPARRPTALHQVEHAFRQARPFPERRHHRPDARGEFASFEHHRIAREQRRHDVSVRQVRRKIERPQHSQYAVGAMPQAGFAEGRGGSLLPRPLFLSRDRKRRFAHNALHFAPGVPEGLAHLKGDAASERFGIGLNGSGEGFHDRNARRERGCSPCLKGALRGGDRIGDVLGVSACALKHNCARRRIPRRQRRTPALPPLAVNEKLSPHPPPTPAPCRLPLGPTPEG